MPATVPYWAVALTFWIHMLATATWIGSLVAMAALVMPAARRALSAPDQLSLVEMLQRRIEPITWLSVSILIATGLFQMSINPHYNGFLSTSGQWSLALLTKHVLVGTLIAVSAVHTWDVLPSLRRALLQKNKLQHAEIARLRHREGTLLKISLVLATLILLATAFARAA
ncbi:MAG TPA: CopD family protein [Anaerolineales bacterium]